MVAPPPAQAESRPLLRAAIEVFDAIGTVSWGDRAREELRASGETSRKRSVASWDQLSAQELQIAQMAANGLSNREIGQRLYVSHRTVGSHLYRIYPKLGVTSRAQLHGSSTPRPRSRADRSLGGGREIRSARRRHWRRSSHPTVMGGRHRNPPCRRLSHATEAGRQEFLVRSGCAPEGAGDNAFRSEPHHGNEPTGRESASVS